jgi:hypothetical protein
MQSATVLWFGVGRRVHKSMDNSDCDIGLTMTLAAPLKRPASEDAAVFVVCTPPRQNHDAAYSYSSPKTYHLSHSFAFQLVTQTAMADLPPPVQGPTAKERK